MADDRVGRGADQAGPTAEQARRYYQERHGSNQAAAGEAPMRTTASHQEMRGDVEAGQDISRGQRHPDPQYHQWREAQMGALDRDYDAFRNEHTGDPAHAFGTWRTTRQSQRDALRQVREHQEVVGRDGVHVGTVDKVRGDDIVLTRNDPAAGGAHHLIPSGWIQGVGEKVMLDKPGEQARREWMSDGRDATGGDAFDPKRDLALGEKPHQGSDGPHILDRSFSGTYES